MVFNQKEPDGHILVLNTQWENSTSSNIYILDFQLQFNFFYFLNFPLPHSGSMGTTPYSLAYHSFLTIPQNILCRTTEFLQYHTLFPAVPQRFNSTKPHSISYHRITDIASKYSNPHTCSPEDTKLNYVVHCL